MNASPINSTPLILGNEGFTNNLSPDALMTYLQTRLDTLDVEVDTIFNDQQRQQKAQALLRELEGAMSGLDEKNGGNNLDTPDAKTGITPRAQIEAVLKQIGDVDPHLAESLNTQLHQAGQILAPPPSDKPGSYTAAQVEASTKLLQNIGKDLESQASLNMIRLQSIMSTRQTAVQLATNLVSALGETTKAVVANVGH